MSVPNDVTRQDQGLDEWCILHGYRGAIAHGMYEPSTEPNSIDDKDTMAICVAPVGYYFRCTLPLRPDRDAVDALCVELVGEHLGYLV